MIGLRYNDQFLDVDTAFSLSWEQINMVFQGSDSSKLPGSFSFPFTIPASDRNRALLNYPERIDNASPFIIEGLVYVMYDGKVIFQGTMKVTEANKKTIKVYVVANPLTEIKQIPINELDLGGDRSFADEAAVLAHAKDTAENPLDFDYVFFPVYNPAFIEDEGTIDSTIAFNQNKFQNFYNEDTQAFVVDKYRPALMPFVRLEYLLERIFASAQFQFENSWQLDAELRSICLINNNSLWSAKKTDDDPVTIEEGLSTVINLRNHVSKTSSTALVRKVMGAFCLGLFYNPWEKVLKLIPMQTILRRAPRHNWTDKVLHEITVYSSAEQPEFIGWKQDEDDAAWTFFGKYIKPDPSDVVGELSFADVLSASPGIYYVPDRHAYYQKTGPPGRTLFVYTTLGYGPNDQSLSRSRLGEKIFEAEFQALWDAFENFGGLNAVKDGHYSGAPRCDIPGTVSYSYLPAGATDQDVIDQSNDIPDRFTIYRGMYESGDGLRPLALGLPWDPQTSDLIGQYSLRWDGEYGMYETWWSGWHTMLRQGKNITLSLALTIPDLLNFNFEDKVRILNQDFIVKKLKVTLTHRGLEPVVAELVSTI